MYTILLKTNLYTQGFSSLGYLLFEFSPKGGNRQTLWKENIKSFVLHFAIFFSIRTLLKRAKHPRCFKKRSVVWKIWCFKSVISGHGENHQPYWWPKRFCYCFFISKCNIHLCLYFCTGISNPQRNCVHYYAHYAIHLYENTFFSVSHSLRSLYISNNKIFFFILLLRSLRRD